MSAKIEVIILGIFGLIVASILGWLSYLSPGVEGGMDSYNHYLIARYTWSHPELFLDQWGKPLFNIIASPFAQLGINGVIALNRICLLASSYLAYAIAKIHTERFAFLAFILTLLSPIFLDNTISALTEPLCALFVTASIYFLSKEKYITGAILAGLLPYARSEGFIILGVILIFLILTKQYKSLPYLFIGSFVFNTLGWIIEGDPFWIITQNPYINFELSGRNVCGSGGISHYYYSRHYTFGQVTSFVVFLSGLLITWKVIRTGFQKQLKISLILVVFGCYFLAHVLIWWLGMMGSCGYVRVMTVISPLAAILVTYTIHHFLIFIKSKLPRYGKYFSIILLVFLIVNALYAPYKYYKYKYPLQISDEQQEYVKLADWLKSQPFESRTKVYLYPYLSVLGNINHYDKSQHLEFWHSSLEYTKKGDILIWDSHFGPNESNTPLSEIENDVKWRKIHAIVPDSKIPTVNDAPFEIHVFERIQ